MSFDTTFFIINSNGLRDAIGITGSSATASSARSNAVSKSSDASAGAN